MMTNVRVLVLVYLLAMGQTLSAGVVLASNLSGTVGGAHLIGWDSSNVPIAQQFSTDSSATLVTSVNFGQYWSGATPNVNLAIYTDVLGSPGVDTAYTFSQSVGGSTDVGGGNFYGIAEYDMTSGASLTPNTTYWLVLTAVPGANQSVGWTAAGQGTGAGFMTGVKEWGGSSWFDLPRGAIGNGDLIYAVQAAAPVPEPVTASLASGLAALLFAMVVVRTRRPAAKTGLAA